MSPPEDSTHSRFLATLLDNVFAAKTPMNHFRLHRTFEESKMAAYYGNILKQFINSANVRSALGLLAETSAVGKFLEKHISLPGFNMLAPFSDPNG